MFRLTTANIQLIRIWFLRKNAKLPNHLSIELPNISLVFPGDYDRMRNSWSDYHRTDGINMVNHYHDSMSYFGRFIAISCDNHSLVTKTTCKRKHGNVYLQCWKWKTLRKILPPVLLLNVIQSESLVPSVSCQWLWWVHNTTRCRELIHSGPPFFSIQLTSFWTYILTRRASPVITWYSLRLIIYMTALWDTNPDWRHIFILLVFILIVQWKHCT